ncbi:MAG: hypothetical protein ACR2QE_09110, partial [Acidimicrobiales bacterium]
VAFVGPVDAEHPNKTVIVDSEHAGHGTVWLRPIEVASVFARTFVQDRPHFPAVVMVEAGETMAAFTAREFGDPRCRRRCLPASLLDPVDPNGPQHPVAD